MLRYEPSRSLRSSWTGLLTLPRVKAEHGGAAFSFCAPHYLEQTLGKLQPLQLSVLFSQSFRPVCLPSDFIKLNSLNVCVAVRIQMVAKARPTEKWWSQWLRWRRGFHQTNAVAAKPALWRPYIMHSPVSNKCKVNLDKQTTGNLLLLLETL